MLVSLSQELHIKRSSSFHTMSTSLNYLTTTCPPLRDDNFYIALRDCPYDRINMALTITKNSLNNFEVIYKEKVLRENETIISDFQRDSSSR